MMGRSTEGLPEPQLLLRGWSQAIVLQAVVTLATLPMLRVQPASTVAATVFNLVAILNTCRIHRLVLVPGDTRGIRAPRSASSA